MAAGSDAQMSDATQSPAAVAWLKEAVELHRLLLSAHHHEAAPDVHDSSHASTLHVDVHALRRRLDNVTSRLPQAPSANYDHLSRACRKVGLELCLKLERLEGSGAVVNGCIDGAQLHDTWCVEDVDALGSRLEQLVSQSTGDIPFKFTARSRDEVKTEKSLSQDMPPSVHVKNPPGDNTYNLATTASETPKKGTELSKLPPAVVEAMKKPRPVPASLLYDFILEGLAYKSMHDREEEVVQAHRKTLEWVFAEDSRNETKDGLSTWLATDTRGPIYWITGKPGSGKSTFMRFLFHHERTAKNLRDWAAGSSVRTAGFFFWTSGSREQRSQTGLLRSLLHQLLSANTHLIPSTFPSLWDKLRGMSTKERVQLTLDWSAKELMAAFHQLLDAALPSTKVCLFIDGLDEFDGDHQTIIKFFRDLGRGKHSGSIKMCLSSRPWAVFEEAFGHSVPHLRLQDLTYDDMRRYTQDRLRESSAIRNCLDGDDLLARSLVKEAVDRADGVFLWVRLAANEMICNFTSSHSPGDLFKVLRQLPSDLNELFWRLLFEDQTAEELSRTAILFQLICAQEVVADFIRNDSANSLTVWDIAFALHAKDDELAIDMDIEEASDGLVQARCDDTVRTIITRFANLLDVHAPGRQGNQLVSRMRGNVAQSMRAVPEKRVTYIHRTVRDWLMDGDGVRARLASHLPDGFDAHLGLLRSYVLRLKTPLEPVEVHRRLDEWWPDIALALTHARYITHDPKRLQRPFVNELNATVSKLWLRKPQDPYDHWARNAFGSYEVRMKAPPIWQPFLCLATKFGLTTYMREELEARRAAHEQVGTGTGTEPDLGGRADATPLLAHATEFLCSRNKAIFPLSDPALVEVLLRNEAGVVNPGPNHPYTDFTTRTPTTPWLALLRHLRDARRRDWIERYDADPNGVERWASIVRLFVEVGQADPTAVVVANGWDPEISALGVLELLDETYGALDTKELREGLQRKLVDVRPESTRKYVLRPRTV